MGEEIASTAVRDGVGEGADRVDGVVDDALVILYHVFEAGVEAAIFVHWGGGIVGESDDFAFFGEGRGIAAVAQP